MVKKDEELFAEDGKSRLFEPILLHTVGHEGSSSVMSILKTFGLFLGTDLSVGKRPFYEYKPIQKINKHIIQAKGFPYPWDLSKRGEILKPFLRDYKYIQKVRGDIAKSILDQGFHIKLDVPWGWKDPRTTITLPFWIKVFPRCKIIFLKRDKKDAKPGWHAYGDWGYDFYDAYRKEDMAYVSVESNNEYFVLSYDELSNNFAETCKKICDFMEVPISDVRIDKARRLWKPKYDGKIKNVFG